MSVGELVSLYRDGELEIHPEFQRFFRWSSQQKSKFIESLLLGIPIPSIFVSQTATGTWDVVDGLQRISTILELMGELIGQNDVLLPPLVLEGTRYLPSLENRVWDNPKEGQEALPPVAKLKIKRSRFDIKIVLNTSDSKSKYELFQRLNTGGSLATDQEVRNCILIMVNRDFYQWLVTLKEDQNFQSCIPISERQKDEQYDMELVVRFVTLWDIPEGDLNVIREVGTFMTDKIIAIAEDIKYQRDRTESAFRETFRILANTMGEDSFKKYNQNKGCPTGPVLISMFEIVCLGIAYNSQQDDYEISEEKLREIQKSLWNNPQFVSSTGSGIRASIRLPITIPMGRNSYHHEG
ncbi:MAG: DUF262 domain-containing protein [Desulfobacteraceae bacterium]|nr:MAG: DUF262 domain-containing protein [Desulfobacteraceae bacterium]